MLHLVLRFRANIETPPTSRTGRGTLPTGPGGIVGEGPMQGTTPRTTNPKRTYRASFIKDISLPDGYVLAPNTTFSKKWLLKNTGNRTWDGCVCRPMDPISHKEMVGMGVPVPLTKVGSECLLEFPLMTSAKKGLYRFNFKLFSPRGEDFGPLITAEIYVLEADSPSDLQKMTRAELENEVLKLRQLIYEKTPKKDSAEQA